jgi:hypothetical protein
VSIRNILGALAATAALTSAGAAGATTVNWVDWTAQTSGTHVDGTLTIGANVLDIDYDGAIGFTQTNGGTDYWAAQVADYTDGAVNRPTGSDIIALNAGGQKVVTFSQAVINPFFAFSSWNGNTVDFSAPFTIVGQGCGHWGCGTFVPNVGNTGFTGSGEVHGVLQFQGTFTSISFTDVSENWHGFTVGAEGVSTGAVPEPATWAMMILGFGAAGAMLRRRRTAIA